MSQSQEQKNKEKNRRLYRTYGITLDEYNHMLGLQYGRCWICGRSDGRLCIDHVHIKGFKKMEPEEKKKYIRGILCFICNTALKGFERTSDGRKNRSQFEGTVYYFAKYPLKGEI